MVLLALSTVKQVLNRYGLLSKKEAPTDTLKSDQSLQLFICRWRQNGIFYAGEGETIEPNNDAQAFRHGGIMVGRCSLARQLKPGHNWMF